MIATIMAVTRIYVPEWLSVQSLPVSPLVRLFVGPRDWNWGPICREYPAGSDVASECKSLAIPSLTHIYNAYQNVSL